MTVLFCRSSLQGLSHLKHQRRTSVTWLVANAYLHFHYHPRSTSLASSCFLDFSFQASDIIVFQEFSGSHIFLLQVFFVQEFCNLSKHLQPVVRSQLFRCVGKQLRLLLVCLTKIQFKKNQRLRYLYSSAA